MILTANTGNASDARAHCNKKGQTFCQLIVCPSPASAVEAILLLLLPLATEAFVLFHQVFPRRIENLTSSHRSASHFCLLPTAPVPATSPPAVRLFPPLKCMDTFSFSDFLYCLVLWDVSCHLSCQHPEITATTAASVPAAELLLFPFCIT